MLRPALQAIGDALFGDKLVEDHRQPLSVIQLFGWRFAVLAPSLAFWTQLLYILLLQIVLQCAFATIIYSQIVKNRGTSYAYLLGFGCIIPLTLCVPYQILDVMRIENKALKLGMSTYPTVVAFRCVEAMFGTSPATVEASLGTYVTYYTSLMHFEWDPKTLRRRRISSSELLETIRRILLHFHLVSVLLSFEMHYNFRPFKSGVPLDSFYVGRDLFSPEHLLNCYLLVFLTLYMLSTSFEIAAFAENAKGLYTKSIFHNPLWTSRTPTEFWGAKWNLMIHRILKHGVYLPVRKVCLTPWVAITATFIMSGLLHEYSWTLIFYRPATTDGECTHCYTPVPLKLTLFFLWCGVVMLLERPLAPYFGFAKDLPTPLVATIQLVVLALPISHWFTGDWAVGGMFSDFALALWHIKVV